MVSKLIPIAQFAEQTHTHTHTICFPFCFYHIQIQCMDIGQLSVHEKNYSLYYYQFISTGNVLQISWNSFFFSSFFVRHSAYRFRLFIYKLSVYSFKLYFSMTNLGDQQICQSCGHEDRGVSHQFHWHGNQIW